MTKNDMRNVPFRHCEAAGGHQWKPTHVTVVAEGPVDMHGGPTVRELLSGRYNDWEALPGRTIVAYEDRFLRGLLIHVSWKLRQLRRSWLEKRTSATTCPARRSVPNHDDDLPF